MHGLTTVQGITQESYKVIVSNIWSEFVIFPETVDQMLTVIFKYEIKMRWNIYNEVDNVTSPVLTTGTCRSVKNV